SLLINNIGKPAGDVAFTRKYSIDVSPKSIERFRGRLPPRAPGSSGACPETARDEGPGPPRLALVGLPLLARANRNSRLFATCQQFGAREPLFSSRGRIIKRD